MEPTASTATDDDVALYAAARGFLWAEWLGALVLLGSFTQLYVAAGARLYSAKAALATGAVMLAGGAVLHLWARRNYARLGLNLHPRWHDVAAVVAGSAGIFWLLFLLLAALTAAGVGILPEP